MPATHTTRETAEILGISRALVNNIERKALRPRARQEQSEAEMN